MKKLFTIALLGLFSISAFAQDKGGEMKNFRFGVTALPALTWYKPDEVKKFENKGAAFRFGVLINGEFSFSDNFAIGFGIGLSSSGGKVNFLDSVHYHVYDGEIISLSKPDTGSITSKTEHYLLNTREYKASYYMVPISLKMRTNEIGYMRYFFEPRLNIGIRKKVRADDDVVSWGSSNKVKQENIDITPDMAFLKTSVTLSGGGEYYLSGSTAFVFSIGYDYGLSNAMQKESDNLQRTKGNPSVAANTKPLEQKFTQNGFIISLGILF